MNFFADPHFPVDGDEWRGVRTKTHSYDRWLSGDTHLYDLVTDPLQLHNLADDPVASDTQLALEACLKTLLKGRGDTLPPSHEYADWFDAQRRIVRNAFGSFNHPESTPDWSLLRTEAAVNQE
jgi:hypothetical protein